MWHLLAYAAAALGLSACTVADSYRVAMTPAAYGEVAHSDCASEAGAYALSSTTWSFDIVRYGDSPYILEEINERRHPDGRFTYCLDYVANALASDTLDVGYTVGDAKTRGQGLLSHIASFAIDRTPQVVRNIIRAIFIGVSGKGDFGDTRIGIGAKPPKPFGHFEVDPLDAAEMASLNVRLADFGFCLLLDGYSVDRSVTGQQYCANPIRAVDTAPSAKLQAERTQSWLVQNADQRGILYRPRIPYTLEIYTQDDPRHSAWMLRKTQIVQLENIAPIISLHLNRAAFAEARVGMEFDEGALTNVCLYKTSEIAGFVDIPLDIVYGIASLPAETIRAEVNRATQTQAVINAERELIVAQRNLIDFQKQTSATTYPTAVDSAKLSNTTGCETSNCPQTSNFKTAVAAPASRDFLLNGDKGICKALQSYASAQ